ncbi:MAG: hypothetical protein WKG32_09930 [Gemmatimonadaceae bacterium]
MPTRRVRESAPIQVYLDLDEQHRLARLAEQLDESKSEILRRGLLALEREVLDPAAHAALRLIGIATAERPGVARVDAAREHDRVLADAEEASWAGPARRKGSRRAR